ncbi:hypothetical protein ACEPPN_000252 [Leptodophora sp. 'Broadleaf-Isolate-01']
MQIPLTPSYSAPGGLVPQPVITSPLAVSTATTAVPKPTNGFPESNANCAKWYVIQDGDYCQSVSIAYSISLSDFYFLNPEINANCTNLDLGIAYCVQAVGSISTYSGYPTTTPIYTLTSLSYATTTVNFSTVANVATPIVALSTAPGTISDCSAYIEWVEVPDLAEQASATDVSVLTDFLNDCNYAVSAYGVDLADFLSWNPVLASYFAFNRSLVATSSHSVLITLTDNWVAVDGSGSLCAGNATAYTGTISTCSCFTVIDGSIAGYLASDANITTTELAAWNPWIGSDCDTGLYANLNATDSRAVCIGINSTAPASTSSSTISSTSTVTPPAPTQTGIIAGCTEYYVVVSGDSCAAIESEFSITFAQFYAWNPAVGSNCENLWIGEAYCVAAPTSSTTTSISSTVTPPAPTQSGIVAGCTEYYVVVSGDSCAAIESEFSITFAQFYAWNPAVGSNCENLWLGEAYCVAAPTSTTTSSSTSSTATPPAPTQSGIVAGCTEYYVVQSGDSCASIESEFSITFAQLYAWNPAVGSNCENLWLDEAYCVAV